MERTRLYGVLCNFNSSIKSDVDVMDDFDVYVVYTYEYRIILLARGQCSCIVPNNRIKVSYTKLSQVIHHIIIYTHDHKSITGIAKFTRILVYRKHKL